ncbi:DUTP diphosphatase [uncultured virus]|nr:DUTP diphosphatase [uncultured virus]
MHVLKVKILDSCPNRALVQDFYENKVASTSYARDCGVDLIFPADFTFRSGSVTKAQLGIACELILDGEHVSAPFDLVSRSSIINTPLMLANGVGIFDPDYRGPVIAAFRCMYDRDHPTTIDSSEYTVKAGQRLVQIVAPDRRPIRVELVETLTETERGGNGFGSTNTV